jgi:hypothetical protein
MFNLHNHICKFQFNFETLIFLKDTVYCVTEIQSSDWQNNTKLYAVQKNYNISN